HLRRYARRLVRAGEGPPETDPGRPHEDGQQGRALRRQGGVREMPHTESRALTLSLSRFAVEGTPLERPASPAPSTAKQERVGVRARSADSVPVERKFFAHQFLLIQK